MKYPLYVSTHVVSSPTSAGYVSSRPEGNGTISEIIEKVLTARPTDKISRIEITPRKEPTHEYYY